MRTSDAVASAPMKAHPLTLFHDITYLGDEQWVHKIRESCAAQGYSAEIDKCPPGRRESVRWGGNLWIFHTLHSCTESHHKKCSEWFHTLDRSKHDLYVIKCDSVPPNYKIGIASHTATRLSTLQRSSPFELELVAVLPGGGRRAEVAIHRRFAHLRLRGEWFRESPELLSFIVSECEPHYES